MDMALEYLVNLWNSFLTRLDGLEIVTGVSLLGVLIGCIVILIVLNGLFGRSK